MSSSPDMDGVMIIPLLDFENNNSSGEMNGKPMFFQGDESDDENSENSEMDEEPEPLRPLMTLRQRRHSKLLGIDIPNLNLQNARAKVRFFYVA